MQKYSTNRREFGELMIELEDLKVRDIIYKNVLYQIIPLKIHSKTYVDYMAVIYHPSSGQEAIYRKIFTNKPLYKTTVTKDCLDLRKWNTKTKNYSTDLLSWITHTDKAAEAVIDYMAADMLPYIGEFGGSKRIWNGKEFVDVEEPEKFGKLAFTCRENPYGED